MGRQVCRAHNLSAFCEQIPHLHPYLYFSLRTCRREKWIWLCFVLTDEILRSFFWQSERPESVQIRASESVKILLRSILTEMPPLTRWASRSATRIICSHSANKFHTCRPICIFRFVHAGAKNRFDFVSSLWTKFCEAFFWQSVTSPLIARGLVFFFCGVLS